MKNRLHKRLSAWLLTLVMLVGMLPAMASADEVGEDLAPPAPQEENYGYVRLVFAESEQLDLCHGEYITECSPTAEVFGNASEDFITDGEYAALYYEGKLYHKAALDGVSINADAVLPAEDFALVPMGELAAQAPSLGEEPVALNVEGTNGGTNEGTTEGTTEQQETLPPLVPPAMKAPQLAATEPDNTYGMVVLNFPKVNNESRAIKLYSGQYIVYCNASTPVLNAIGEPTDDYLVWYHEGILYLNGDLQDVRINLRNADRFPNESQRSVLVYVKDNVTMSGCDTLLDLQDGINATLHIDPGKRLTLNLTRNAQSTTRGAAIDGGGGSNLTVIGGGELHINAYGSGDKSGSYTYTFGIALRGDLTLSSGIYSAGSPDVRINVSNDSTNTESDKVFGVDVHGLTVKDESFLKIDVTGRALDPKTEGDSYAEDAIWGRVNGAISADSMKLLDKASVDITSHKNVVSDIALTGGGEVLKVDTEGYFHITNYGNITRYPDDDDHKHKLRDHPDANIYLPNKEATANIVRVEAGMVIDSYSRIVDKWYDEVINGTEQWNWVIGRGYQRGGSIGKEPTLGTHMYVGTRRVGEAVEVSASDHRYTWGKYEYIYSPAGVATVKQSSGLTMDWEKPEGSSSSVHYARVIEPGFNNIHVVHKGADLSLEAPEGKGTFLYWYDALHPEGSGNGTSWTKPNQTFSNIQQDMVLVPVRDPMKTGPTLSDVGYSLQWDTSIGTNIRYAYQDLTFEKADEISTSGGHEVMLVPAQLPTYGEKTYAVKDLKNRPLMGLCNARLYADEKAYGSTDALGNRHYSIPTESYRIAYNDDATNKCFFSKPFTFDPPVAPPYIDPATQIFDTNDGGTKTVKITAEREAPIKYCLWDYTKNKWGGYIRYTEPFDVTVTADQDVRIAAYADPITPDRRSEVRYAVRPSGVPTVKYGDTVISTTEAYLPERYFYGSIELTVEAPDGYEVWYNNNQAPYETNNGIEGIPVEGGKVTLNNSGEFHFKLAKVFTVDGVQYRKLANSYTRVKLSKLDTLPVPNVTFSPTENYTLDAATNTVTVTGPITATLSAPSTWPINAEMVSSDSMALIPNCSPYQTPYNYDGTKDGHLRVGTRAKQADGKYEYVSALYKIRLPVTNKLWLENCTATVDGNPVINGAGVEVGKTVILTPKSEGVTFKEWYSPDVTLTDLGNNIRSFVMPDKAVSVKAIVYANEYTSMTVIFDVFSGNSVVSNMSNIRHTVSGVDGATTEITFYKGNTPYNNGALDKNSGCYRAHITCSAAENAIFSENMKLYANCNQKNGQLLKGGFTLSADKKTLEFDVWLVFAPEVTVPLYEGEPKPTAAQCTTQPGIKVDSLTWNGNTIEKMIIKDQYLVGDSCSLFRLADNPKVWINGVLYDATYSLIAGESALTVTNKTIPTVPKGVEVNGTITSYGSASEAVTVTLTKQGETAPAFTDTLTVASGSAPYSQTYSFPTVPAGTYTLKVEKKGHAPWTESITVGDGNVTKDVTVYLYGDVNRNGTVTSTDALQISQYIAGTRSFDAYQMLLADVNRKNGVTSADALWVSQRVAGTRDIYYNNIA